MNDPKGDKAVVLDRTIQERNRLLREYQRTRSRELRDSLLEYYLPLVHVIARRILASRAGVLDFEDLVGVGSLALFDSLLRFDALRGVAFSVFAGHRIRGAILDELRKLSGARRRATTASRAADGARDDRDRMGERWEGRREAGRGLASVDLLVDPKGRGLIDDFERREVIDHLTTTLDARERNILRLYYGRGITMREISQRLGLSVPRVSALHASILGRLQARFKELRHEVFS